MRGARKMVRGGIETPLPSIETKKSTFPILSLPQDVLDVVLTLASILSWIKLSKTCRRFKKTLHTTEKHWRKECYEKFRLVTNTSLRDEDLLGFPSWERMACFLHSHFDHTMIILDKSNCKQRVLVDVFGKSESLQQLPLMWRITMFLTWKQYENTDVMRQRAWAKNVIRMEHWACRMGDAIIYDYFYNDHKPVVFDSKSNKMLDFIIKQSLLEIARSARSIQ